MAEIIVKSNLNPHKSVTFNVSIKKFINSLDEGEGKYFLEVGTTHSGISVKDNATYSGVNGISIRPVYLDKVANSNLDNKISEIIGQLSSYIDWEEIYKDTQAPYITDISPVGDSVNVYSNLKFTIKDSTPTDGIDISEMKVKLNNGTVDFDITNEVLVYGNPFEYNISWEPKLRVM